VAVTPEDPKARDAAEGEVDPDRLLPGEDPDTPNAEDASHWLDVYTQLLQGKTAILAALNERLAKIAEDAARQELADTDVVTLDRELSRIHRRLDFWSRRRDELEAAAAEPGG
jgi:hypothetical protein